MLNVFSYHSIRHLQIHAHANTTTTHNEGSLHYELVLSLSSFLVLLYYFFLLYILQLHYYYLEIDPQSHPHFKPAEPYRFNISPEGLQNSGKCYTYDYSFIIAKRYKAEPAKVREHSKDSGKFQIGNFLALGDVSHSRHPCATVLRVPPIQDASQSSSAKDLLGFHK